MPYPTLLAEDGARHEAIGPTLGATRDSELDGTHSASADADGPDEDGTIIGTLQGGQPGAATVNVQGGPAKLDAWIDFNGDGNWDEPSEQIADNLAVIVGYNLVSFDVPIWAVGGTTFARFRLSSAGDLGVGGLAADGEVEDRLVMIVSSSSPAVDLNGPASGINFGSNWRFAGPVSITDAAAASVVEIDGSNLTSLTATITGGVNANNVLSANTAGTSISQSYNAGTGVLTLSGADSAANYQAVLRTVKYDNTGSGPGGMVYVNFVATDAEGSSPVAITTVDTGDYFTFVVSRRLFYNQSGTATRYDGNNLAINSLDDRAIATDKTAYLWEDANAATFANVSSYTKGINGIMYDIFGSHPSITAADFIFKVGNNNSPGLWGTANAPTSVSVRAGAGVSGSDRVEIIWNTGAPIKQWLEVIVLANANTGLAQEAGHPAGHGDAFFFGSAVGDSGLGDTATNATVNATDENGARNNPASLAANIPITNIYDYDRNAQVNANDQNAARNNATNATTVLKFINLTTAPAAPEAEVFAGDEDIATDSGVASALTASAPTSGEIKVPGWLTNRLDSIDLNSGIPAKVFQHLHDANTLGTRTLLQKIDAAADALGLDDELLDSLLADLGR